MIMEPSLELAKITFRSFEFVGTSSTFASIREIFTDAVKPHY